MKLTISEAAEQFHVETHVLRYWEEELGLKIPRNKLGHRFYREEDIKLLKGVCALKRKNFSLRAIKILLPEAELVSQLDDFGLEILKEELEKRFQEEELEKRLQEEENDGQELAKVNLTINSPETNSPVTDHSEEISFSVAEPKQGLAVMEEEKVVLLFEKIMTDFGKNLVEELKSSVTDGILKEVDYMMRMQEEREEEYFKRLDETIRSYQNARKQVAVTSVKKKGLFGSKR